MKHLKIASYLLIMVTFLTSCEEETLTVTEITATKTNGEEPSNTQFFFSEEDFPCSEYLPFEDFNEVGNTGVSSPLDESSNVFNIPRGISFESQSGNLFTNTDTYYQGSWYRALYSSGTNVDLVINFSINVKNVGMLVHNRDWSHATTVEVYGNSGMLESTTIQFTGYTGTYVGFSATEPITQIILKGTFPGVDNITFGDCEDYDSDGCFNEEDAYPHSNMNATLSLGENSYEDIDNILVDCGTTMQDQIDNLISQINSSYYGDYRKDDMQEDNWEELHEAFSTKLAHITYYWRINKLITAGERAEISSDAWSADIPYREVN